ncbi:kallikrein 1-related peptidase b3-like [Liolophura sinensis]|uniref:kallikrein 1-related peptidase b3-like n=1 Tax=Liolophura sinensis TaxID=3198878 RepID=UPI0031586097
MISGKTILGFLVIVCGLYVTDAEPVLNRVRRLINGQAEPNGQPWMTVLAYKNTQPMDERPYLVVCGSVLIDESHVLITAHCFDENIVPKREGSTLFVVLGLKDNSWGATNDVQEFALDDVQASVTVLRYL